MQYTRFGATELNVSRVCFGNWQAGGDWGTPKNEGLRNAVRRALELGINFFDTAQAYGFGDAEKLLGEALRPELSERRDELVLATKGGLRMTDDGLRRDAGPDWLRQGLEESLRYLGTDYVDLYQVHWPDPETPIAETAGVLDDFVREGKVRYVGVSNWDAGQMAEFETTRKLDSLQPPYSLFRREIEDEVLPFCREHGVGVLVYGPMAHCLLTGKFFADHQFAEDDWRAGADFFQGGAFERNIEKVEELRAIAEESGHSVAQLAVAWTLANPDVDVAIVGARTPEHIQGTAPAADFDLTEADLARIEEIMTDAATVSGPSPEGVV